MSKMTNAQGSLIAFRPERAAQDSPGQSDDGAAEERRPGLLYAPPAFNPERVGRNRACGLPNPFRVHLHRRGANPGRRSLRSLALGCPVLPFQGKEQSSFIGRWSFHALVIGHWL